MHETKPLKDRNADQIKTNKYLTTINKSEQDYINVPESPAPSVLLNSRPQSRDNCIYESVVGLNQ
jgi:hypothetical protein